MRTTIRMDDQLAKQAKSFAEETGRTFTQIVEEAVTQLLRQKKKSHIASPAPSRLPVCGGDGFAADISPDRVARQVEQEEDAAYAKKFMKC